MAVTRWGTDYFEKALLDYLFNGVAFQPEWWVALGINGTSTVWNARTGAITSGAEISGNNYARKRVTAWEVLQTFNGTYPHTHYWTHVRTTAQVQFDEPSANWGVSHVLRGAFYDASSGGNVLIPNLAIIPFSVPHAIVPQPGYQLTITSGCFGFGLYNQREQLALEFQFTLSGITDVLNHIFGISTRTNVLEFGIAAGFNGDGTIVEPSTNYARQSVVGLFGSPTSDGTYWYVTNPSEIRFGPVAADWNDSLTLVLFNSPAPSHYTDSFCYLNVYTGNVLYAPHSLSVNIGDYLVIPAGNIKFRMFG